MFSFIKITYYEIISLDHEHLSVNPDSLIVTSAYANEDFIIPCRPTSPDVTVDLNYSSSQSVVRIFIILIFTFLFIKFKL